MEERFDLIETSIQGKMRVANGKCEWETGKKDRSNLIRSRVVERS